jgi:hypothetical protein
MPLKFTDDKLHAQAIADAKRKFRVYPSAYANGWMTKRYKQLYAIKKGRTTGAFKGRSDSLTGWFKEGWVGINSSGTIVGECGGGETKGKVKCLPKAKAEALSKRARAVLARRKQRNDPDPDRTGAPVMVSSKIDAADTNKWLVWFSGRNTGTVVHANSRSGAISRARANKVVGSDGKIDAARRCNDRELALIKKGTWIRTRANGKETGGAFKFRSWMKN